MVTRIWHSQCCSSPRSGDEELGEICCACDTMLASVSMMFVVLMPGKLMSARYGDDPLRIQEEGNYIAPNKPLTEVLSEIFMAVTPLFRHEKLPMEPPYEWRWRSHHRREKIETLDFFSGTLGSYNFLK
ncbi:hypothetical protein TIFTF001_016031 [Ficus carica]|uniref:Uncharacterized protein n=1 Tax=Ficus carica TaxID=3494 RepID=A0AA88A5I8_FICCA|nr:hypothetical protein TIFTF001_016031 [Ficus carica]